MEYFTIGINTNKSPYISRIVDGLKLEMHCKKDNRDVYNPAGTVVVELDRDKGCYWPDILLCGAYPLFIISNKFISAVNEICSIKLPVNEIIIVDKVHKVLKIDEALKYYWIDGKRLSKINIDFLKSGFVDNGFCTECGTRYDNTTKTTQNHLSGKYRYEFLHEDQINVDLFISDISDCLFFCSKILKETIQKSNLKGFLFNSLDRII